MVTLIISGGQSGADLGGLKAGKALDLSTGGYMPKGWRTEDGPKPEYEALYGMYEWDSEDYIARTKQNVLIATATVIFGKRSIGSNRTEEFCRVHRRPKLWVSSNQKGASRKAAIGEFKLWVRRNEVDVLNVAGNRESVNPGVCKFVEDFIKEALT